MSLRHGLALIAVCLCRAPTLFAAQDADLNAERVWMGSSWGRCDPAHLVEAELRGHPTLCTPPADTSVRVLPGVPLSLITWDGAYFGGGLGCVLACTCVHESAKPHAGMCDVKLCPGDRVGRAQYRFLGIVDDEAFLEAPLGRKNCWKAKLVRRRRRPPTPRRTPRS